MSDRDHLRPGAAELHGRLYLLLVLAAAAFALQVFVIPGSAQAARSRWAASREPRTTSPARQAPRLLTREAARHVITGGEVQANSDRSAGMSMTKPSRSPSRVSSRVQGAGREGREEVADGAARTGTAARMANPPLSLRAAFVPGSGQPDRRVETIHPVSQARQEPVTAPQWLASTPPIVPPSESASLVTDLPVDPGDHDGARTPGETRDDSEVTDPGVLPPDPEALLPQVSLHGEAYIARGEVVTILVTLDSATGVAHAPLRLTWNPDVLSLEGAGEGQLLASDGAATQFMAIRDPNPGAVDLVMSRIPPAGGIAGHGVLCAILFRAHSEGESPIVLTGSRLLDAKGRSLRFKTGETHVAVN